MRITLLLEVADQIWGGVKVALEDANWLSRRGHQVTVVSRSGPPAWMKLECGFQQVEDFRPEHLPDGDVLIGTFWSTVPWTASAGPQKGVPVHLCQGYEGDNPENESMRDRIEATYRLPGLHHITISPHLTALMRDRFGIRAHEVTYVVDHDVHKPAQKRPPQSPLRVGLVGPYAIPWKDLPTGYQACQLAHKAGQNLILVRASNTPPSPEEQDLPFPVEWHQQLRPDQMGDYYRSLDVFLGTSSGVEEGFFLPAIEAMACGVPSVLTDIPCFRNHTNLVNHDRYALFVDAQDPTAMAEAIVLAGALPDVRTALRAGGIEVASHYHPDRHGEQLEQVLQQLAATTAEIAQPTKRPNEQRPQGELRLLTKEIPTPPLPVSLPMPERSLLSGDATSNTEVPIQQVPQNSSFADSISSLADKVFGKKADNDNPLARLLGELHDAAHQEKAKGNFRNVARLLEAARCLSNDDKADVLSKATSRLASGNAEQALQLYDERLESGDDDEELHTGRGNALHALGRIHEAAQAFRAALAVGARTPDNYNRLGVVLYQAGDLIAARQSFERALMLNPNHIDARANLSALPAA
ncbi:MAG: glycosyltransferase involved in cell wall biosynthesis [Planctomycetota bacterium]|jgi:glycosyltransferase involved in cell wall biosynthesis